MVKPPNPDHTGDSECTLYCGHWKKLTVGSDSVDSVSGTGSSVMLWPKKNKKLKSPPTQKQQQKKLFRRVKGFHRFAMVKMRVNTSVM